MTIVTYLPTKITKIYSFFTIKKSTTGQNPSNMFVYEFFVSKHIDIGELLCYHILRTRSKEVKEMNDNTDARLFAAFIHAAHYLRAGRPSGAIPHGPDPCAAGHKHKFRRETVLPILLDHDGGMRQNRLANRIRVSPSTLSEMLNRLEADGYIRRCADPTDRRATILELTPAGQARAEELKSEGDRIFAHLFSGLSDDEKVTLIRLLEKMTA